MSTRTAPQWSRRILVVDCTKSIRDELRKIVAAGDGTPFAAFDIQWVDCWEDAVERVHQAVVQDRPYAAAFIDVGSLPPDGSTETIWRIWGADPEITVVPCGAGRDSATAKGATAKGATAEMVRRLAYPSRLLVLTRPFDPVQVRQMLIWLTSRWEEARRGRHELERMTREAEAAKSYTASLEAANKALEQSCEVADAATRAKSEFLANMSHEIRTPMTAILGFAENMLLSGLTDPEQVAAVQTIRRNGEHLLEVLNDILDLSKIEAGQLNVERIPCSPVQLVADVRSLLLDRAMSKQLEFEIDYQSRIPKTIQSDPTRLRQILINLVGNAIKFTEHGSVHLAVRFTREENAEPTLCFEVIDTGIGLTKEQIEKIFRPFSQAASCTTRRFGGTGLGLAICRRLVDKLNGRISVESQPGRGSTFRVEIAADLPDGVELIEHTEVLEAESLQAALGVSSADAAHRLDGHVLVAEDAPDNQRLIQAILSRAGADVQLAENGQLAVEMATESARAGEPFDVILMDMQMPVLDGYQATRQLRSQGYTGLIIALTAHAMATDCQKCLDAGCDGFASKPIHRDELIALVGEHAAVAQPPSAVNP